MQLESEASNFKLQLKTREADVRSLKEKVDQLQVELEEVLLPYILCILELDQLYLQLPVTILYFIILHYTFTRTFGFEEAVQYLSLSVP